MRTRSLAAFSQRIRYRIRRGVAQLLPARSVNLIQCREVGLWDDYFQGAEAWMDIQWDTTIWPLINGFDFSVVLELAPGAGRNTEKLTSVAKRIIAVDYNHYALEQTEARLGPSHNGCEISYHRNGGSDLAMVDDASVSAAYCWDSAVHFDKDVVAAYIAEFARVLKPGGYGFLHHSDLGRHAHKNMKKNPHWRTDVDKELVASACRRSGLLVTAQQPVPWDVIVDCATVFQRPR